MPKASGRSLKDTRDFEADMKDLLAAIRKTGLKPLPPRAKKAMESVLAPASSGPLAAVSSVVQGRIASLAARMDAAGVAARLDAVEAAVDAAAAAAAEEEEEEREKVITHTDMEEFRAGLDSGEPAKAQEAARAIIMRLSIQNPPIAQVKIQKLWSRPCAADCRELQGLVLKHGVVTTLLAAVDRFLGQTLLLQRGLWLLANLARPKPHNKDLLLAVPTLAKVLLAGGQDKELLMHAATALSYVSIDDQACEILLAHHLNLIAVLVDWVKQGLDFSLPCTVVLGSLCSGSADMTQAVVAAGAVPAWVSYLRKCAGGTAAAVKSVLWALSNVSAGTSEQVQVLLDAGE